MYKVECQSYYVVLPIERFSSSSIPCLIIQIEGKKVEAELDLGYRGMLVFPPKIIKKIREKTLVGERAIYGLRGKSYQHPRYTAPTVHIGKLNMSHLIMEEEPEEFAFDSMIGKTSHLKIENVGRLGWQLFKNCNLFLDLANSKIAVCDSAKTLEQQGYRMDEFIKMPLHTERGFVEIFSDGPDQTHQRWVLDTGCTWNILHTNTDVNFIDEMSQNSENNIAQFLKIGGFEMGPIPLHKMPIALPIHVDGILGMEFFKDHQVFVEFKENQIYISK